ncbi:MAG: hypothetical protein GY926_02365 [bacterium]|nr:hypothetical protein [bacterium]
MAAVHEIRAAALPLFTNNYNYNRPHGGKWNNGKPPAQIIIPNNGNTP